MDERAQITSAPDLYGTAVKDWVIFCRSINHAQRTVYMVLRALAPDKWGGRRDITLSELAAITPGVGEKPMTVSALRPALAALTGIGLITDPDGGPLRTSSRKPDAVLRIQVNHMPPAGYRGFLSARDAYDSVAGQISNPPPSGPVTESETGQISNPLGQISNPTGQISNPQTASDLRKQAPPNTSSNTFPLSSGDRSTTSARAREASEGEREESSNSNYGIPQQPSGHSEGRFAEELQQIGAAYRNAYGDTMPPASVSAAVKADAIRLLESGWPAVWIAKLAEQLPEKGYTSLAKHAEHNPPPANVRLPQNLERCFKHPSTLAATCGLCASEEHVDNTLDGPAIDPAEARRKAREALRARR